MSQKVMLELPDEVARRARTLATQMQRPVEDLLVACIDRAVTEPVNVDLLPDDQVLALCDSELEETQQTELSELLDKNREGSISDDERRHLNGLLDLYRQGWLRKAQAWKTAVSRGLRPPLN